MGSFANSLFKLMLGWLQTAVSAVWTAFTSENGNGLFNWIGKRWILIAGILCAIGLSADLCVYVLRWKRVRKRNGAEEPETEGEQEPTRAETTRPEPEQAYEPDFSAWEPEEPPAAEAIESPAEQPSLVTNAGYVVPADSPYRRPTAKAETASAETSAEETGMLTGTQGTEPTPIVPRRRRRINVNELFSDPEEELRPFEAPQHVIDSRKAYHDPVYPRGWKQREDKAE